MLIMHLAIPEHAGNVAKRLHATPSRVGQVAQQIQPQVLVLSHFMKRSLANLETNLPLVTKQYRGKLILAEDLQCLPLN